MDAVKLLNVAEDDAEVVAWHNGAHLADVAANDGLEISDVVPFRAQQLANDVFALLRGCLEREAMEGRKTGFFLEPRGGGVQTHMGGRAGVGLRVCVDVLLTALTLFDREVRMLGRWEIRLGLVASPSSSSDVASPALCRSAFRLVRRRRRMPCGGSGWN